MKTLHRQLCEIGERFLKRPESANGHGCHFAVVEAAGYGENPDVFGVRHGGKGFDVGTIVLEVKTSRADFLKDRKKPHRINPETGMGKWRYYICPTDLIKRTEIPEKWGLIYVNERGHCQIVVGAMAVPKIKSVSPWSNKPQYHRNGVDLAKSFSDHAFHERNIQNEMNLLTMALARLSDAEAILYMQREFSNRLQQLQTLKTDYDDLKNKYRSSERLLKWHEEKDMSVVRNNLLTIKGYTPYCGNDQHGMHLARTQFKDGQFHCFCGWVSQFDDAFIAEYKAKWGKS